MDRVSTEVRSKIMRRIKSKDTKPEKRVRSLLHAMGYRFRLHRNDLPGKPDIVLPKYKTVIFVHGCFWHGHSCIKSSTPKTNITFWKNKIKQNKIRDQKNIEDLNQKGFRVIIVWECEIYSLNTLKSKFKREL